MGESRGFDWWKANFGFLRCMSCCGWEGGWQTFRFGWACGQAELLESGPVWSGLVWSGEKQKKDMDALPERVFGDMDMENGMQLQPVQQKQDRTAQHSTTTSPSSNPRSAASVGPTASIVALSLSLSLSAIRTLGTLGIPCFAACHSCCCCCCSLCLSVSRESEAPSRELK